jgi:hypothetical protein
MEPFTSTIESDLKIIQAEIARASVAAGVALNGIITANMHNRMAEHAIKMRRGITLFSEPPTDRGLPNNGAGFYDSEYAIVKDNSYIITNYGRILYDVYTIERKAGLRLTDEVIAYVRTIVSNMGCGGHSIGAIRDIISEYEDDYAFAANSVHEAKVEAVHAEIEGSLSAKFQEVEAAKKQVDAMRRQLAEQSVRLHNKENALKVAKKSLDRAQSRIINQAILMDMPVDTLFEDDGDILSD